MGRCCSNFEARVVLELAPPVARKYLNPGDALSIIAECNDRVAAAQRRMLARQARLREDFLVLKDSWGATLTQPLVLFRPVGVR